MDREKRDLLAGFTGAIGALFLFAWLATEVFRRPAIAMDGAVRDGLHAWASPGLTWFFRAMTFIGTEAVLVPLGAAIVWRLAAAGRRHAAVLFAVSAAGGEALDFTLKMLFRRARPEAFFGLAAPKTYSFPSGHAMLSACFFGVLAALVAPRLKSRGQRAAVWAGAAGLALLIGVSRIYLGVHYPSDVAAGYAAAVVWVFSVRAGYEVWRRRRAGRAAD